MEDITCVGDLSKVLLDNAISEWDLYFFKASNKKYKIKKVLINQDSIRGIIYDSIEKYNEKLIATKGLVEYGSFDDEQMLKSLSLKEECISMMYQKFLDTLLDNNPKGEVEEVPLLDRDCDGFLFVKPFEDGNRLILGYKSKLVAKKRILQFKEFEEGYDTIDNRDFVTLSDKIDFVIYGDNLYSLDYKFEKIFWVGDFNRLKVMEILNNVEKTGRITPAGMFRLRNSKQKRQLLKFKEETFDLINEANVDILNNYGDYTLTGKQLAFDDDFSAKAMIKLFTGKLFFADGKAWVGTKEELEKPVEEEKIED